MSKLDWQWGEVHTIGGALLRGRYKEVTFLGPALCVQSPTEEGDEVRVLPAQRVDHVVELTREEVLRRVCHKLGVASPCKEFVESRVLATACSRCGWSLTNHRRDARDDPVRLIARRVLFTKASYPPLLRFQWSSDEADARITWVLAHDFDDPAAHGAGFIAGKPISEPQWAALLEAGLPLVPWAERRPGIESASSVVGSATVAG
jgi:hypothetical protein